MKTPKILVVEDETIVARDIRTQLETLGYEIAATTPRGEEAITLSAELRPDLVLMDIRLAGTMDGIEAARSIRDGLSIPVVFLTAFTEEETLGRAKRTEPFGYIIKPFDERELRTVIEIGLYRHQAEAQRDRFFNLSPDLLCIAAEDGYFKRVNPAFHATLGYTNDELLNRTFLDFVHLEDRKLTQDEVRKVHHGEQCAEIENRYQCKDGSWRWISWKIQPFRREGLLYCAGRDVTRLKTISAALSESEARLRTLNENLERTVTERTGELTMSESLFRALAELAPVGIFRLNSARQLIYVNDQWCELTGIPRKKILDHVPGSVIHPEDRARVIEEWAQASKDHRPYLGEFRLRRSDGAVRWVLGRSRPEFDPDGQLLGHLGTLIDITERKLAEAQLLRQERLESIGRLAGSLAHDFSSTLMPILMGIERLRTRHPEAKGLIDNMEASAQRGAEMVRRLLTYGRGAKGERRLLQPRQLLHEIEQFIAHTFPANIKLQTHYAANLDTILGDATQLHQVLLNLCLNARDAMPDGGTLTLGAEQSEVDSAFPGGLPESGPGRYFVWTVQDTGVGMPPEILDQIFEPFFSSKSPDKGTGLGLSTVSDIVKLHGGFVRVRSEPGKGSTFTVYLPVRQLAGEQDALLVEAAPAFQGHGETILVVDDEAAARDFVGDTLKGLNYRVATATNGVEALAQLVEKSALFFAVITDIRMPLLDGLTLVKTLKQLRPEIPVIVISGCLQPRAAEELQTLGVSAVLTKPFTPQVLTETLRKLT